MWQALDLADYWRDHPPVHEMIAAYLGIKPRAAPMPLFQNAPSAIDANDPSGFGALIKRFPGGFIPADH